MMAWFREEGVLVTITDIQCDTPGVLAGGTTRSSRRCLAFRVMSTRPLRAAKATCAVSSLPLGRPEFDGDRSEPPSHPGWLTAT